MIVEILYNDTISTGQVLMTRIWINTETHALYIIASTIYRRCKHITRVATYISS